MPVTKISQLTAATQVNAADEFEIVQSGVSKRAGLTLPWVFSGQVTVGSLVTAGAITAASITLTGAATIGSLTSGRIPYASTGGLLVDSANLRWDNTNSQLLLGGGTVANPAYSFGGEVGTGIYLAAIGRFGLSSQGSLVAIIDNNNGNRVVSDNLVFGLSTVDVILTRDAANTLAQRNGTAAQAFRLYNTFTDASNYERLVLKGTAGFFVELAAETAGTGGDNLDVLFTPAGTGAVRFGTHTAIGAETVTGYITIKDSGGTSRKLAVVS